jgi:dienelactone hydrolase
VIRSGQAGRYVVIAVVALAAVAARPSARQAVPATQPSFGALMTKAERLLDSLLAGQFEAAAAEFDAAMKAALTVDQLRAGWRAVLAQSGAYMERIAARVEQRSNILAVIITCQFERGRHDVQLFYNMAGQVSGLAIRPAQVVGYATPAYVTAGSFTEREVSVGAPDWRLPGTLTVPAGGDRVPAVVLVHGSGPLDRDGSVGAVKPYRDLALGLASQGIAVLRYEKRSRMYGQKLAALPAITVQQEVIDDVLSAVAFLRAEPAIDASRIVVLGHSLGAMLVPRIAAADGKVAAFVLLAAPARPLEELMLQQTRYQAEADGTITPVEQLQIDAAMRVVNIVRALTPESPPGTPLGGATASYWLDLKGYDPPREAAPIARPLLVLQGERDAQVTMEDFDRWKAALGGKASATLKSYSALNHLFVEGAGRSLPTEYLSPGHVSGDVVRDIADWIRSLKGPAE